MEILITLSSYYAYLQYKPILIRDRSENQRAGRDDRTAKVIQSQPFFSIKNFSVPVISFYRSLSRLDMSNLKPNLPIIELTELAVNSIEPHSFDAAGMKGIELATVVIGGLIFAGGTATALCIACARYRR